MLNAPASQRIDNLLSPDRATKQPQSRNAQCRKCHRNSHTGMVFPCDADSHLIRLINYDDVGDAADDKKIPGQGGGKREDGPRQGVRGDG